MKRPYLIAAPPYRHQSAGIACLYTLCDKLNKRGFTASIHCLGKPEEALPEGMQAPIIGMDTITAIIRKKYFPVVLYPEIIKNNLFGTANPVWWYLNRPEFWGAKMELPEDATIFYFSAALLREGDNDKRVMIIPTIDTHLFHSRGADRFEKRTKACWYVGGKTQMAKNWKSIWEQTKHIADDLKERFETVEITQQFPKERRDVAALFRECALFYCWDNLTALYREAVLCGCPTIIVPDGETKEEAILGQEWGANGISWGTDEDEVRKAILSLPGATSKYKELLELSERQIDRFVSTTQGLRRK